MSLSSPCRRRHVSRVLLAAPPPSLRAVIVSSRRRVALRRAGLWCIPVHRRRRPLVAVRPSSPQSSSPPSSPSSPPRVPRRPPTLVSRRRRFRAVVSATSPPGRRRHPDAPRPPRRRGRSRVRRSIVSPQALSPALHCTAVHPRCHQRPRPCRCTVVAAHRPARRPSSRLSPLRVAVVLAASSSSRPRQSSAFVSRPSRSRERSPSPGVLVARPPNSSSVPSVVVVVVATVIAASSSLWACLWVSRLGRRCRSPGASPRRRRLRWIVSSSPLRPRRVVVATPMPRARTRRRDRVAAASCRRSAGPSLHPGAPPVSSAPPPAVALSRLPTGPLAGRRRGSRRCGSPLCSLRRRRPGRASRPRPQLIRAEAASVRRRPVSLSHAPPLVVRAVGRCRRRRHRHRCLRRRHRRRRHRRQHSRSRVALPLWSFASPSSGAVGHVRRYRSSVVIAWSSPSSAARRRRCRR